VSDGFKLLSKLMLCYNVYNECFFPGQRSVSNLGMTTVSAQFNAAFRENVKQTKKTNGVCIT